MPPAEELPTPVKPVKSQTLRFLWWNVQDFYHFVSSKSRLKRWPKTGAQYAAKSARVDSVFKACVSKYGALDVIALGEITRIAATELRDRLFPQHRLHSLDNVAGNPDAHVAFLYPPTLEFNEAGLFAATSVPRTTRPMALLDFTNSGRRIRFIAAHWTARFDENSDQYQEQLAQQLRGHIYDFIYPTHKPVGRNVVILGDLNAEPFSKVMRRDFASTRSRVRTQLRSHPTDKDVKRLHLYDCAWRLLGETNAHDHDTGPGGVAGTYYWKKKGTWHTLDHVIVSGGLLTNAMPYLCETSIEVFHNEELVDTEGHPSAFEWIDDKASGLSDHLPVVGSLVVEPEEFL